MKKPLFTWSASLIGALALCSVATPARAQEATTPPPVSSPPPMAAAPAGGASFGGGAIGIGATTSFAPATLGGADALFVYDQPMFHIDVALGYLHEAHSPGNTSDSDFRFGVGGWYHLARGSMADFSIGGTVGLDYSSFMGGGSQTSFMLAPGAQARLFLSPNFALMGDVGLVVLFGDNNHDTDVGILGQTVADFGFTYFFR